MDYYIKGECLLATSDSYETNVEAREAIIKARETYTDGLPSLKAQIVADVRLGYADEARELLNKMMELTKDKEEERIWAKNMLDNLSY